MTKHETDILKFFSLFIFLLPVNVIANPWANINYPSVVNGPAQSIGTYDAGCISGAVSLPINGDGYQIMRLSRQRFYGHPDLKQFIETIGHNIKQKHLGVLLIGDLGQPRGGPTLSGHRSHQTGLDVDIWFLLSTQAEKRSLTTTERESMSAPSVVSSSSNSLNLSQWSNINEQILQLAAESPLVDRIFVNAAIKKELCQHYSGQNWIRKIRPWWKHDDHFHVRLKCPIDSPYCESQPQLPSGDGCDASLAWWFSEEANKPTSKPVKPKEPILPILCQQVLKQ